MNPPYGTGIIDKWIRKAFMEAAEGNTVVCLLPARTDTAWFHNYCAKGVVLLIRGRLRFSGHKNSAPFPSMIVIFHGHLDPGASIRAVERHEVGLATPTRRALAAAQIGG